MRLIDADTLEYKLGASERDIYVRNCLEDAPSVCPLEWIPISERPPKRGKKVLFCDDDGDIYVGHHAIDYWWSVDDKVKNVVAWMPLPKAYEVTE